MRNKHKKPLGCITLTVMAYIGLLISNAGVTYPINYFLACLIHLCVFIAAGLVFIGVIRLLDYFLRDDED